MLSQALDGLLLPVVRELPASASHRGSHPSQVGGSVVSSNAVTPATIASTSTGAITRRARGRNLRIAIDPN
jgi:hypothetical protein